MEGIEVWCLAEKEKREKFMVIPRAVGFFEKIKAYKTSKFVHVMCGVLASTVFTFAFQIIASPDAKSMLSVLSFNLFFVLLSFLLDGPLKRKLTLLISGGCLFLLLNRLLDDFSMSLAQFYRPFEKVFVVLSPFANMIWIVSFWSFGLTFLAGSKNQGASFEVDH